MNARSPPPLLGRVSTGVNLACRLTHGGVSIHAPAVKRHQELPPWRHQELTPKRVDEYLMGPRAGGAQRRAPPRGFQSTRPRGARQGRYGAHLAAVRVSIHAPARGATGHNPWRMDMPPKFQSTRPRGARPVTALGLSVPSLGFQSTRPRGARRVRPAGSGRVR